MPKVRGMSLVSFQQQFGTEKECRAYLLHKRWPKGFVCPKCGVSHHYVLSNGMLQCASCRHQTSVTAGTVMHGSHAPLTKWFLAMYFVSQDKRGISAMQLQSAIGVTYKSAWYMLARIRKAMGQRDDMHRLSGAVEFDDAFFGGPTIGKKRGRGTEKTKVFVALSLDQRGNPRYLKMKVTQNIKQAAVRRFAQNAIALGSVIHSDGYRSYTPALAEYDHQPTPYNPDKGLLHWIHIAISNAKAFILGTYHGLPSKHMNEYLAEYAFRFSRRDYGAGLLDRLAVALAASEVAYSKG